MTANKPMTGEQLDELMTVAVNMQRDSEKAGDRPSAMFAYAVQVAVLELRKVRNDAAELEQQLAESHRALRAETTAHENLQMQVEKLAAENAGLKELIEQHANSVAVCPNCSHEEPSETDDIVALYRSMETPSTDAFLAELRAQSVEEFLRGSQLPYQIATVLADYDSVDDATLQTVIWSWQPPEPDGDVWHLEYVSRGNAIVRAVLKELRKGVQS